MSQAGRWLKARHGNGVRSILTPAWRGILGGGGIVLAALAVYRNSFSAPFVYDDVPSIVADNPTLRRLWPIWPVFSAPPSVSTGGRPMANLSLALNHALGGTALWGYHALNLAIHILAGLTLFGLVRRTLGQPIFERRLAAAAGPGAASRDGQLLAFIIALLWTVHPLQTESVTYVIQRTESMMGLFYLLTLYCFVRSVGERAAFARRKRASAGWEVLSVVCCLFGMACTEVMVSAPLLVLLYDRTFVAGSFGEAWRRRQRLYAGLAATWIVLALLVVSTGGNRGGTVGMAGHSWLAYVATQFQAAGAISAAFNLAASVDFRVWHLLGRGRPGGDSLCAGDCFLAAGVVIALYRRPEIGFLGVWFFAILAPTSLVPGGIQMIAEHRMYLSLAAVIALFVIGAHRLFGRQSLLPFCALALGFGFLTCRRNQDYASELSLWSDTVRKRPGSALDHEILGNALGRSGRPGEAVAEYETALRLDPEDPETHYNLGNTLAKMDRLPEAIEQYRETLRLKPDHAQAQDNLGISLLRMNRVPEAIGHFEAALRLVPDDAQTHNNLGNALAITGRLSEAIAHYREALRLNPEYAHARANLDRALAAQAGSEGQ